MSGSPPAPYMHMPPPQPGMQMVYAPAMAPQHIPYGAGGPPVRVPIAPVLFCRQNDSISLFNTHG